MAARHRAAARPRRGIGLALAGGGPMGATYEIGALVALEEALPGLQINGLDGYVGVSAGALVAAGLANGMTPRALCAAFIEGQGPEADRISPSLFYRPALGEYAARAVRLPALAAAAAWGLAFGRPLGRRSWLAALERLGQVLPTGLFTNAPLQQRVREVLSVPGRSDDFRALARRLVVVATDLDSGEAVPFGQPGFDHVPISQAVAASAALPGLFPPVVIEAAAGRPRWYVDGALKKTLHASVLLEMGFDLVVALNPLVPFDARRAGRGEAALAHHRVLGGAHPAIPELVRGGLPVVLSQTFRTLIRSRLELGLRGYEVSHPGTDIVLLEPDAHDPELFLANIFSYSQRRAVAEHAYQRTRADLRSRRGTLGPLLARHGLALDEAVLDDPQRRLLPRRLRAGPLPAPRAGAEPAWPKLLRYAPAAEAAHALRRLDEVLMDLRRLLAAASPAPGLRRAEGPPAA